VVAPQILSDGKNRRTVSKDKAGYFYPLQKRSFLLLKINIQNFCLLIINGSILFFNEYRKISQTLLF